MLKGGFAGSSSGARAVLRTALGWATAAVKALVGSLLVALAYQIVHWSGIIDPRVLPSVIDILRQMLHLAVSADYLEAVGETVTPALLGLTIAATIAIPLGLLLGISQLANRMCRGLIDIMRSLPGVALIPVGIFIIGQGDAMKIVVVLYVTIWPILFNTMYGIASVDKVAIESARSCRVEGAALWRRVMLPSAAPFVATGIRYAVPISIVAVITAEIVVGSPEGIGGFLLQQQANVEYRPDMIYAVLLCAGVVGFALDLAFETASSGLVGWETRRGDPT